MHWKPNLMRLPRCAESKRFITELAKIYKYSVSGQESFSKAMVIGHLILQRDIRTSNKSLKEKLTRRMNAWCNQDYDTLFTEAHALQQLCCHRKTLKVKRDWRKTFINLVTSGRLGTAMHQLESEVAASKPLHPGDMIGAKSVRDLLSYRHPMPATLDSSATNLSCDVPNSSYHPIIFDAINSELIVQMAKRVTGGAGPSGFDGQSWTHMLTKFGRDSAELAESLAIFTRALATEHIPDNVTSALSACRLIALTKKSGIRPIGICDVSRRIMTKVILSIMSNDIQQVCGRIQMCAGQRAGVECVTRAVCNELSNDPNTVLLSIDADNAFNRINRRAAIQNIDRICPALSNVMHNFYDNPSNLTIGDELIQSQEGFTQGDVLSMPAFAIAILPLIHQVITRFPDVQQFWYADDGNMIGKPSDIKDAFDFLCNAGPVFGFHVNPKKCTLYNPTANTAHIRQLFWETEVEIRNDGTIILGAPVGDRPYILKSIKNKVLKFCALVEQLAEVGVMDTQIAYVCFTKSLQHKWAHTLRTTQCSPDWFIPLQNTIRKAFDDILRLDDARGSLWPILSLPLHCGGLGIVDPCRVADEEYNNSLILCEPYLQGLQGAQLRTEQYLRSTALRKHKQASNKAIMISHVSVYDENMRKTIEHSTVKGGSSWLSAFPTRNRQSRINNATFRDAIAARYNTLCKDAPPRCSCGSTTSLAHCLSCPKGGHPSIRHDSIRDIIAKKLTEVCDSVSVEPMLNPVDARIRFEHAATTTDPDARLDISCSGFYGGPSERTLFDNCVFNAFAPSNLSRSISSCFEYHEQRKCSKYQERVSWIERANFSPIVLSCLGGEGKSASRFLQRLAYKLAAKKSTTYAHEITRLRETIGIQLARCISMCIRGPRSAKNMPELDRHR